MTVSELALILIYTCVLLIKTCRIDAGVCSYYGFGDDAEGKLALSSRNRHPSPKRQSQNRFRPTDPAWLVLCTGVYLFFVFFGLSMMLLQLVVGAVKLYITGRVPKLLLVAQSHSIPPSTLVQKVAIRRHAPRVPAITNPVPAPP